MSPMARWIALLVTGLELAAQTGVESVQARAAQIVREQPNYMCSRTIERSWRGAGAKRWTVMDTLKLEVAYVEGKELFGWPGAQRFEDRQIPQEVGGDYSTGDFAIFTKVIFQGYVSQLANAGVEEKDGRNLIRLTYEVPRAFSRHTISANGSHAVLGYKGTAWVDARTFDPVRLEIHMSDIPRQLKLNAMQYTIEYARLKIGVVEMPLPATSEVVTTYSDGVQSRNRTTFANCRLYGAQSVLTFNEPSAAEPAAPASAAPLAAGIELRTVLSTRINLERIAVGDAFTAELADAVQSKGQELAPKGAKIEGYITRLTRPQKSERFWRLGLHIEKMTFDGKTTPLKARLIEVLHAGAGWVIKALGQNMLAVGAERSDLKRGLVLVWRTE